MENDRTVHESIVEAVCKIRHFIKEVTGEEASQQEIAKALTGYFVLNEIREYIEIFREEQFASESGMISGDSENPAG